MSTTKTITLSMESLNKLYFQFFQKFVSPNLTKTVNEITQLLRNKSAYDVYKYLQQLLSKQQSSEGYTSNQMINSLNTSINNHSVNSIGSSGSLYQYALPTNGQIKSTTHSDYQKYDKAIEKSVEDSISFKNKLVRRTLTGLPYEEPKNYQFKNYNDDANQTSIYTNPPPALSHDFKLDLNTTKDPLSMLPILTHTVSKTESTEEGKSRGMKQIVRRVSKVFNQNHSKIEKYNKNTSESNKLFNINTSTRLDKKEDSQKVKYQFKTDLQIRKH